MLVAAVTVILNMDRIRVKNAIENNYKFTYAYFKESYTTRMKREMQFYEQGKKKQN